MKGYPRFHSLGMPWWKQLLLFLGMALMFSGAANLLLWWLS